jgi:hypothetical protein
VLLDHLPDAAAYVIVHEVHPAVAFLDNCPDTANADQDDSDGDGIGDACEETPSEPDDTGGGESDGDDTGDASGDAGEESRSDAETSGADEGDAGREIPDDVLDEAEIMPCGAGLCGAGMVPMLPFMLLALCGTKCGTRRAGWFRPR